MVYLVSDHRVKKDLAKEQRGAPPRKKSQRKKSVVLFVLQLRSSRPIKRELAPTEIESAPLGLRENAQPTELCLGVLYKQKARRAYTFQLYLRQLSQLVRFIAKLKPVPTRFFLLNTNGDYTMELTQIFMGTGELVQQEVKRLSRANEKLKECLEVAKTSITEVLIDIHKDTEKLKESILELAKAQNLAIAVGNTLSSLTMDVPQVDWREKYNKNLAEEYQKQLGSDIKNHPFITFMSNKISPAEEYYEDLIVTQETETFLCPISQAPLKDPVKHELCGHVFEKEAIEQLLNIASLKTRKVKCPHIGCGVYIESALLKEDSWIKKRLKRRLQQQFREDALDQYHAMTP
ncbi:uncharacterized protein LOC135119863 [Zophobas morio]|uniref:uncharacterized protein LOC135119863 n=1 Tax=Zophobas morio TaxID=2755281 RepID=UPI0030839AC5